MLTRKQLVEFYRENLPLHILELDYVQSFMLKGIYARDDRLVFKGGTCLRKAFGLDRYSEDLDFNLPAGDPGKSLEDGLLGLKAAGIRARISKSEERKDVFLATLRYRGPLYTGLELTEGTLQVEVSKRSLAEEPEWITVMSQLPDVGTYSLLAMSQKEMLAEKMRALAQRGKARDLYDIWFLMRKGVRPNQELLDMKLDESGVGRLRMYDILKAHSPSERDWKRDMGALMARVPERAEVLEYVRKGLGRQ